ncbi:hypothetical protein ACNKHN_21835 [Shigella flexneri]
MTWISSYSSSHDPFHLGSSFINFNLPQFYQIVKVDGHGTGDSVSHQSIGNMPPANQEHDARTLQQYFS